MRIFDEKTNKQIFNPDETKGCIRQTTNNIHIKYIVDQKEKGHEKIVKYYPESGGQEIKWVIDVPEKGHWQASDKRGVFNWKEITDIPEDLPHEAEFDNIEYIGIYHTYTQQELQEIENKKRIETIQKEVEELKQKLLDTDYIACKIAEGAADPEQYTEQLKQRQEWRDRINELQNQL